MIYLFLADGFEEIEALATVDILRRASLPVLTVSVTACRAVRGSHDITVEADAVLGEELFASGSAHFTSGDALVLPGGMPGAANLDACKPLHALLHEAAEAGALLAAICAAPSVLGHAGLLAGCRATCYPGFEQELLHATPTGALVEHDRGVVTGKGPGAAFAFAYKLVDIITGSTAASQSLRKGMIAE